MRGFNAGPHDAGTACVDCTHNTVVPVGVPLRGLLPLALVALAMAGPASAQVQRSFLNQSFEQPALTASNNANGCYRQLNSALVPGWSTTHPFQAGSGNCTSPGASSGPLIELWRTNFQGVVARSGANFSELNAEASSRIYQNICLIGGERIKWRFSHRGRSSTTVRDVMDYKIGAASTIVRVGTTSDGAFNTPVISQGTAVAPASGGNGWVDYQGEFNYAGASGVTNLGFESISTGGGSLTSGNFLDNIQIELSPFVEFTQPSSSTPESASNNLPTLRVNGTVLTAFTVTVEITGGTATMGDDFTTPGNSTSMTVNVPAGIHDGLSAGSLFPLPITVVNDTLGESNETIQLRIVPPTGSSPPFQLVSSTACGVAGQTMWDYTIVDDDARITITKDAAAPVAVAGSLAQYDVDYTITVNNPSNQNAQYNLIDTPAMDPNVSVLSASSVRTGQGTGGGAANRSFTGADPWTLAGPQRGLGAGQTDTFVLTVRLQINQGGPLDNDNCVTGVSGNGLYNSATATLNATGNPAFESHACRNTPTPVWVTLRKQLQARAVATDQTQVRLLSGGIQSASATTTGSGTPATATTGMQVLPVGSTLQFEEAIKANGTGADQALNNYATQLTCTNAATGSTTVLPGGSGIALANRQQWPEFTPTAGDVLDCTITNTPAAADLSITKTNTAVAGASDQADDTLVSGARTTYQIVVRDAGSAAANGAVLRDPAPTGLSNCALAAPACTASGGATCPATGNGAGQLSIANLQAAGAAIPVLPNGGQVTVSVTCTVD